ncbi:MAG TPA: peptidylprolyl isomerase [Allosphingosinicella sp.]|uniref:peptidylprolyl isomerase n=1 Tax=Allosphingosinicella sp. TaxID=2823234 RepID=UPI002ED7BE26
MRKSGLIGITSAFLASCAPVAPPEPAPAWRPTPVAGAVEPSETIKNAPASAWRDVEPENLLLMDLKNGARIAIELAPEFAPVHVANIRAFARAGWWNNAAIYRVQDNYVVQWGNGDVENPLPAGVVKAPPAEYDRALAGLDLRPLGYPDAYAPMVGHANGWPVGYDPESGRAWLTHCYAMVGVGRDLAPDTGTGGELYAVIGHAPRHLDLNIATVGRVLEGFQHMTALQRGTEALGFIKEAKDQMGIARVRLAADLPAAERPSYEVMRTDSDAFAAFVLGRANRGGTFFQRPAGGADLCNAPVPARKKGG